MYRDPCKDIIVSLGFRKEQVNREPQVLEKSCDMWHCSSKPIDITGARATRGISYQAATPVDVPAVSSLALPPAASACTMNLLNLLHEFGDELTIEYYCIDTKKAPGMK